MIKNDPRVRFVKKWYERGVTEKDPFDKFFSLWIALIVAASRWLELHGCTGYGRDKDKVRGYLLGHREQVRPVLAMKEVKLLAQRRGSSYGNAIVDYASRKLREKFEKFAGHYGGTTQLPENELVEILGEILNKIRNNAFHGVKIYDAADDIAVLKLVNPILVQVLRRCEAQVLS